MSLSAYLGSQELRNPSSYPLLDSLKSNPINAAHCNLRNSSSLLELSSMAIFSLLTFSPSSSSEPSLLSGSGGAPITHKLTGPRHRFQYDPTTISSVEQSVCSLAISLQASDGLPGWWGFWPDEQRLPWGSMSKSALSGVWGQGEPNGHKLCPVICSQDQQSSLSWILKHRLFTPYQSNPRTPACSNKPHVWGIVPLLSGSWSQECFLQLFPWGVKFTQEPGVLKDVCASSADAAACTPPVNFTCYHAALSPGHFGFLHHMSPG